MEFIRYDIKDKDRPLINTNHKHRFFYVVWINLTYLARKIVRHLAAGILNDCNMQKAKLDCSRTALAPIVGKGYKLQRVVHEATRTRSSSGLPPPCHRSSTICVLPCLCQQLTLLGTLVCHRFTTILPTI